MGEPEQGGDETFYISGLPATIKPLILLIGVFAP